MVEKDVDRLIRAVDRDISAKDYASALHQAQQGVELALKGIYDRTGITYAKVHDVGKLIGDVPRRFNKQVKKKNPGGIDERTFRLLLAKVSVALRVLTSVREYVTYASDELGVAAASLFDEEVGEPLAKIAQRWLKDAAFVLSVVQSEYD
jgi:HEPN domain-containing protein